MIPKIIHYCWFGRNPMPKLAEKCIRSWKKYCPDYTIIEWNEDNYDISAAPLYVRRAYEAKKWAFVTDYVRLDVVYQNGGIYLDTDVEVLRNLDCFLSNKVYFGLESAQYINTGLGFGAEKGSPILAEMMADYQDIPFVLPDGSYDKTTCPVRNTNVLLRHGFQQTGKEQMIGDGIHIYPTDYFCPKSGYDGSGRKTRNTYSIHHFDASWFSDAQQKEKTKRWRRYRRHWPFRLLKKIIGEEKYEALKKKVR